MLEFIYDLYKNDSFTVYLTIALVVLIVLFVIVLIFGKRDKKLEETRRLEKISVDTFKEADDEKTKVEVPVKENNAFLESQVLENATDNDSLDINFTEEEMSIINAAENALDKVNDSEEIVEKPASDAPVEDALDIPEPKEVNVTVFEPTTLANSAESDDSLPDVSKISPVESEIEKDLQEISNLKELIDKVEIPNTSIEEEIVSKPVPDVFSSVYVNRDQVNETIAPVINDVEEEKPVEKAVEEEKSVEKAVEELPKDEEEIDQPFFLIQDDDDLDLPSLK